MRSWKLLQLSISRKSKLFTIIGFPLYVCFLKFLRISHGRRRALLLGHQVNLDQGRLLVSLFTDDLVRFIEFLTLRFRCAYVLLVTVIQELISVLAFYLLVFFAS